MVDNGGINTYNIYMFSIYYLKMQRGTGKMKQDLILLARSILFDMCMQKMGMEDMCMPCCATHEYSGNG